MELGGFEPPTSWVRCRFIRPSGCDCHGLVSPDERGKHEIAQHGDQLIQLVEFILAHLLVEERINSSTAGVYRDSFKFTAAFSDLRGEELADDRFPRLVS